MRTHLASRDYKCAKCDATFTNQGKLTRHLTTVHSDARPFQCTFCDMAFKDSSNLRVHTQRHENKKSFKCSECEAAYNTRGDLLKHMNFHNRQRYACKECDKQFMTASFTAATHDIPFGEEAVCLSVLLLCCQDQWNVKRA